MNDSTPKRAAIYCRVSTSGQEQEGTSLQTQEEACRKYAVEHGYAIGQVYTDSHTGAELYERKGMTRLREGARGGLIDTVIAYTVDRLSRNQAHVYIIADEMERAGVSLEFVTERFEDSAVGKFIRSAKAFAAELELESIKERTMRGKLAKVRGGRPLGLGTMPYGYLWRDDAKTGYEIEPQSAVTITEIFRLVLSGQSMREIARQLTQADIPTPSGQHIPWRHTTISDILRYPGYAGQCINWQWKTHKGKNGKRERELRPQEEWLTLADGTKPAIVGADIWEAAQRLLEAHRDRAGRKPTYPNSHLLRGGFVYCGSCGRPMGTAWNVKDHKPKYICPHARDSRNPCLSAPSIHAHIIDAAVWQVVERILLQPSLIAAELDKMRSEDPIQQDLKAVEQALSTTARKQTRLLDALAESDDDLAEAIKSKLSALSVTKRQLQQEHDQLLAHRTSWQTLQLNLNNLEAWCKQLASHVTELDFANKQLALQALDVKVRVWRADHEPRYEITTSLPLDSVELDNTSRCCRRRAGTA